MNLYLDSFALTVDDIYIFFINFVKYVEFYKFNQLIFTLSLYRIIIIVSET